MRDFTFDITIKMSAIGIQGENEADAASAEVASEENG